MRRAPLVISLLWLVVCVGFEYRRVATFMAQPATGDLYAHSWGFQFVIFVVFRFGFWVAGLLFILLIEGVWHRRRVARHRWSAVRYR